MPWFRYSQNNSGGSFAPPYRDIWIEARSAAIANVVAALKCMKDKERNHD